MVNLTEFRIYVKRFEITSSSRTFYNLNLYIMHYIEHSILIIKLLLMQNNSIIRYKNNFVRKLSSTDKFTIS